MNIDQFTIYLKKCIINNTTKNRGAYTDVLSILESLEVKTVPAMRYRLKKFIEERHQHIAQLREQGYSNTRRSVDEVIEAIQEQIKVYKKLLGLLGTKRGNTNA